MTFAVTPVPASTAVGTAVPGFIQWQDAGVNVGTPAVVTINIESPLIATRGVGEQRNVLTISVNMCIGGPTWTQRVVPNGNWIAAGWDPTNNWWVAIMSTAVNVTNAYTSPDGVTWTFRQNLNFTVLGGYGTNLVYGNGVWLAWQDGADAAYSTNGGVTWTNAAPGAGFYGASGLNSTVYDPVSKNIIMFYGGSPKSFCALFNTTNKTWSASGALPGSGSAYFGTPMTDGNGRIVAVDGGVTGYTIYSTNGGATWTQGGSIPILGTGITAGCYFNGTYTIFNQNATSQFNWTTDGGLTWHQGTMPSPANYYSAIAAQGVMYVVGVDANPFNHIDTSTTGTSFTEVQGNAGKNLPTPPLGTIWSIAYNGHGQYLGLLYDTGYTTIAATGVC